MTQAFERSLMVFALFVVAFLSFPTAIIVPMSFGTDAYLRFPPRGFTLKWYEAYFADQDWLAATWFSVRIATCVAISSVVIGTATAFALLRGNLVGRQAVRIFITGPIILPQIVIAIAFLLFYQRLHLVGSIPAFIAAHTCLALPYVIFTISASLARYDVTLDAAAAMCGAGRWTIFRRITVPLIRPGLMSGGLFAFLVSFDEPVVAFFLSGLSDKAIARKFFEDIQLNVTPVLAAVATLLTLVTITILALVVVARRKDASSGAH